MKFYTQYGSRDGATRLGEVQCVSL
ncbi:hypothetical protein CBM2594_U20142 [Cupriavidus taiwanensis]|uniref:Uncharacterized protein n=1 Tax=Cupriavidus taiwanensis TaxID=164546 RepID=A0A7Z7NRP6_9BURK|nr:hypothetical protein CBM2594_U20142 [Cupriavidus taiwanensis]